MRTAFVPKDFAVPTQTVLGDYVLLPISTAHNQEDYETIIHNADTITRLRGGEGDKNKWPYSFSLEENYKDLAWLETCAQYRQLFCYIIRNKKDNSYAGCAYIYPTELFFPEKADKFDVDFSFWITQKEYEKGVYSKLYKLLLEWLQKNWPFSSDRIYTRNNIK